MQQLLSAAPEALKMLGIAYRAYVMMPGRLAAPKSCSSIAATATACGGKAAGVTAPQRQVQQWIVQQLFLNYRLYVNESPTLDSTGCCDSFAMAVLSLSASLMILLPDSSSQSSGSSSTSNNSGSSGSSQCVAALQSYLPVLLEALQRSKPMILVGELQQAEQEVVLRHAAAAGWPDQVTLNAVALNSIKVPSYGWYYLFHTPASCSSSIFCAHPGQPEAHA